MRQAIRGGWANSDGAMKFICASLAVLVVVAVKVAIGVLAIPIVILMWLYDLGSRTTRSANLFMNPGDAD